MVRRQLKVWHLPPPVGAPVPVLRNDGRPAWLYLLHDPRLPCPCVRKRDPAECAALRVTTGAVNSFTGA